MFYNMLRCKVTCWLLKIIIKSKYVDFSHEITEKGYKLKKGWKGWKK